ncbi:YxeA family protein [Geomicrobium sediminis]|uniref:Uncharacterized protein (TIGR01655 family) n=1 Tax=Geomicrobium sediminis TaxID=1347788 RepID=A0ABS2PA63_9BACL|nr:YxeA family protein [Geomicrobium sediminis]MBM7631738.1 uncharacterized protein (TIGR01655 family) [Geomicrobium sediminis]
MRKAIIGVSIGAFLMIAALVGLYQSLTDMTRANINPFIEEEYWYVQVDASGILEEDERGSVYYELPAIHKDGDEEKEIEFTALSELQEGAYLQLTLKEDHVITYDEVEEDDVPTQLITN